LALDLGNLEANPDCLVDSPVDREFPVCLFLSFSINEREVTTFQGTFSEEFRENKTIKYEEPAARPCDK